MSNCGFYFKDEDRFFGFLRIYTGDELSKRAKFAFITWIGGGVGAMKRAKVSTEKTLVKDVITVSRIYFQNHFGYLLLNFIEHLKNFAVEIAAEDKSDLDIEEIRKLVVKAGGANYGSGRA